MAYKSSRNSCHSTSSGSVRFEVYNPHDHTVIVTGVKYSNIDGSEWREYSDIYKKTLQKRCGDSSSKQFKGWSNPTKVLDIYFNAIKESDSAN